MVEGEAGRCEIGDLKHVEGEASCNSRKGKLIFFYEWNLRLSWKGTAGSGGLRGHCRARRGGGAARGSALSPRPPVRTRSRAPAEPGAAVTQSGAGGDCGSHVGPAGVNACS